MMQFLSGICGRPADEKLHILFVSGCPKPGAAVPAHALRRKPLEEIATFL